MTSAEMRAAFWQILQLDETDFIASGRISASWVKELIMQGIWEMFRRIGPTTRLRRSATISLVADTETYDLDEPFWKWDEDPPTIAGVPVAFRRRAELDVMEDAGTLDGSQVYLYEAGVDYTETGKMQIGVRPVPSSSATLRLYYLRQPFNFADLADGQAHPDLLPGYHLAPIWWACLLFAATPIEGVTISPELKQSWGAMFDTQVQAMQKDLAPEMQANQPRCTPSVSLQSWMDV